MTGSTLLLVNNVPSGPKISDKKVIEEATKPKVTRLASTQKVYIDGYRELLCIRSDNLHAANSMKFLEIGRQI